MSEQDIEIYSRWMKGESLGSVAREYKLKKEQIKKIIAKVAAALPRSEILHKLHDVQEQ